MTAPQPDVELARSSSLPAELLAPVIVKNWRLIVLSTLAALVALYGALLYFSPVYEVSASILLKLGREMAPPATANTAQFVSTMRAEDVASEIEIMHNPYLVQQLVHDFGTDFFTREAEPVTEWQRVKAGARHALRAVKDSFHTVLIYAGLARPVSAFDVIVAMLNQNLSVEQVPKSDVISITLRTPAPDTGVVVLNKFLELYLKQHIAVYKSPKARSFFETESSELEKGLANASASWRKIRESKGVWDIGEQRQLLLHARADLETKYRATADSLRQLQEEVRQLADSKATLPATVEVTTTSERNTMLKSLDDHILELQAKREQLMTTFTPESQVVQDVDGEINEFRTMRSKEEPFITSSVTRGPNDTISGVDKVIIQKHAELQGLAAEQTEEARQISDLNERLQALDQNQSEVERWERELGILNKNYLLYKDRLEDSRISEAMDLANISNVAVVASATAAGVPVWPNKRMWTVAALILGVFGSIGFALLRELLDPTARSRAEIAQLLNSPVIGSVREWRFDVPRKSGKYATGLVAPSRATQSQS